MRGDLAMSKKPLVSVVVPAYNAEAKIGRCIKSITAQSYESIEIIAIDDGSIDKTYQILKELSAKDKRIKPEKQKNSGQAIARKNGVKKSKGKYVIFVDADDYIGKNRIETLVAVAEGNNYDIVRTSYTRVIDGKQEICKKPKSNARLTKREAVSIMTESYNFATPVAQIVKKRLFVDDVFKGLEGIKYAEDYLMNLRLISSANAIAWYDVSDYYYDIDNNSTSMNNVLSKQIKNAEDAMLVYSNIEAYSSEKNAAYRAFHAAISQIKKAMVVHEKYNVFKKEINHLRNNKYYKKYINIVESRKFSAVDRIIIVLLKLCKDRMLYVFLKIRGIIKQ